MSILSTEQIRFFEENGFLILRKLLEPQRVRELKRAVLEVIGGNDKGLRGRITVRRANGLHTSQLQQLFHTHPVIADFIYHPKLGACASALMKNTPEVRLWHDQIIYKPAHEGGPIAWHQDYYYWQHTSQPDMVTAWCALSSSNRENGCMYVIPGSHRWGLMDNRFTHEDSELEFILKSSASREHAGEINKYPLVLEPTDVSFHHSLTIHGSYANESDSDRLGYILHYLPAHIRYVEALDTLKQDGIEVGDGELIRGGDFALVWPTPRRPY